LLKEIAASALMIFFDRDSILLMILLTVGGSWKITYKVSILRRSLMVNWQVREKAELIIQLPPYHQENRQEK
jgi:hypothetical protein